MFGFLVACGSEFVAAEAAGGAVSLAPTLRKKREGWGTRFAVVPAEGWAHPARRTIRINVKNNGSGRGRPLYTEFRNSISLSLIHHCQERLTAEVAPEILREQRVMPLP